MTGRAIPEWIGAHPDAKVPAHVRLRIFRRENGMCHISKVKIGVKDVWQLEHKVALSMGGRHAEFNLFPALVEPHKIKTAEEAASRAKADAIAKRHLNIRSASPRPLKGRQFAVTERAVKREPKMPLKRRDIYR